MPGDVGASQYCCHYTISSCYFQSYCTSVQQLADIMIVLSQKVGGESIKEKYNSFSCLDTRHLLRVGEGGTGTLPCLNVSVINLQNGEKLPVALYWGRREGNDPALPMPSSVEQERRAIYWLLPEGPIWSAGIGSTLTRRWFTSVRAFFNQNFPPHLVNAFSTCLAAKCNFGQVGGEGERKNLDHILIPFLLR